jgi:hypothetical protein
MTMTEQHKGLLFLRYRTGEERRTPRNRFEPLTFSHPMIGMACAECDNPFHAGQRVTLFAVGPDTLSAAEKAEAGGWYTALAVGMHEDCAWGRTEGMPSEPT